MSAFSVWLYLVVIPNLGLLAGFLGILGFGVCAFLLFVVDDLARGDKKKEKGIVKLVTKVAISSVILGLCVCVTPNQKEMAAIITVPYITNNKEMQKLPENLAKKLNEILSEEKK